MRRRDSRKAQHCAKDLGWIRRQADRTSIRNVGGVELTRICQTIITVIAEFAVWIGNSRGITRMHLRRRIIEWNTMTVTSREDLGEVL